MSDVVYVAGLWMLLSQKAIIQSQRDITHLNRGTKDFGTKMVGFYDIKIT